MSLINKMLNDLEKNKKTDGSARKEILSSIHLATQKYKIIFERKVIIWILVLVAVISIFIYFHHSGATKKTINKLSTLPKAILAKKKTSPNPQAPTQPPQEIKKADLAESTIKLKDIALRTENNNTIIDFILSAPALYYIERGADQQQLFITLGNTGLLGNVPVTLDNSFVTTLNTKQNGTSTVCTLTLLPGTNVNELQLIDKPQTILHLVLSNPQLTTSKMLKVPIPISHEQEEEERYQYIQQLLAQNNNNKAISQLRLFLGDFAENLQARETLIALLIKEGALQRADNVLTTGLNKYPNYAPFIKLKARILVEQGKIKAAITLLQKFSSPLTNDSEYFALLAILYQRQGQYMQAAELYHQLTKLQPQKATWWTGLGVALESAGKKNAAKEAYDRAYNSLETTPELLAFLADKIKK